MKSLRSYFLPIICALILAVCYFLFHMHFMQQFLDWDQIVYANNMKYAIEKGIHPLLNTHHLHMETGGKQFHEWMLANFAESGFTDLVFNNRLRSLISACIGIFFLVLLIKNITGKLFLGILGTLLIMVTYGYLHFATKLDTPIYPAMCLIIILWNFQKIESAKYGIYIYALLGGVLLFASIMAHQYMAIVAAVACICLVIPPYFFFRNIIFKPFYINTFAIKQNNIAIRKKNYYLLDSILCFLRFKPFFIYTQKKNSLLEDKPVSRYSAAIVMMVTGIILTAGAYFYAGRVIPDRRHPFSTAGIYEESSNNCFQKWIFGYARVETWGHGLKSFNPKSPLRGFTDSFIAQTKNTSIFNKNYTFNYNLEEPFTEQSFVHNQVAFFTILILAGSTLLFPLMLKRYKRLFLFILISAVVLSLFSTYWEPYYFEFWLVPNILYCILAIMIVNLFCDILKNFLKKTATLPFYAYLLFLILIFFSHNMIHYVVPYSRVRNLQGYSGKWSQEYYMIFSTYIYKHPLNVYKDVYNTTRGQIFFDKPITRERYAPKLTYEKLYPTFLSDFEIYFKNLFQ